jgi:hypothetical protein
MVLRVYLIPLILHVNHALLYRMKIKSNIAISETGFIFNPATGDSFSANAMAAEMLAAIKKGNTAEQVKREILQKYDVRPETLEHDWEDLLLQLKAANLLDA